MTTLKQNPMVLSNLLDGFFPAQPAYYPPVNIQEHEKNYTIELKVPGIKKEDIQIQIEKGLLTIQFNQAETTELKAEKFIKKEFSIKNFKRTFSLDEKIDASAIEANMNNGILIVNLPLKESVQAPKTIINIK